MPSPVCAAVDIGTTAIACDFADSASGRTVARTAEANRQRSCGPDVVPRIEYGVRKPEHPAEMRALVRGQVRGLRDRLSGAAGNSRSST